jgi:hypothetical protein
MKAHQELMRDFIMFEKHKQSKHKQSKHNY